MGSGVNVENTRSESPRLVAERAKHYLTQLRVCFPRLNTSKLAEENGYAGSRFVDHMLPRECIYSFWCTRRVLPARYATSGMVDYKKSRGRITTSFGSTTSFISCAEIT